MNDDLNIRELYQKIIEDRANSRGIILMENIKIPSQRSSPDLLNFDDNSYEFDSGEAFSIIGDTLYHTNETHPYIFNSLVVVSKDLNNYKKIFKDYYVKICGKFNESDLKIFLDKQKAQTMGDTRRNTRSGRIWKNIQSKSVKKMVSVVSFWCREKEVTEDILKKIKSCFTDKDIFWVASDSKYFNYYGDTFRNSSSGEIKELKSKIYPELSHDQIVDILMRAHSGYKITPFEKRIVWEFRGFDPSEIKFVTGGYPTVAEYEYRKKLSEDVEL